LKVTLTGGLGLISSGEDCCGSNGFSKEITSGDKIKDNREVEIGREGKIKRHLSKGD